MNHHRILIFVAVILILGIAPLIVSVDATSTQGLQNEMENESGSGSWSLQTRGRILGEPILCDLDNDDQNELVFSDERDGLHVIDASTGQQLWEYGGYDTSPAFVSDINGDLILDIIASTFYGALYEIAALSGDDGSLLWSKTYDEDWSAEEIVLVANLANDSLPEIILKTSDDGFAVLNGENGNVAWLTGNSSYYNPVTVHAETSLYHITVVEQFEGTTSLVLFNGTNGEIIWKLSEYEEICRQPIVADLNSDDREELIFGNDYPIGEKIIAIDALNGTVLWEFQSEEALTSGNLWASDLDSNGVLEVVVDTEYTHILNGITGEEVWAYHGSGYSRTLGIGDLTESSTKELLIVDLNRIIAFDSETGNEIWARELSTNTYYAMVDDFDRDVLDEILTIRYGSATVLEGDTGQIIWFTPMDVTIKHIIINDEGSTSAIHVILISDYRIKSVELTGFDQNTEFRIALIQYIPVSITIGFFLIVVVIYFGKKRHLKAFENIRTPNRLDTLWQRILEIDPTSLRFKIIMWMIVLVTPFIWVFPAYESTLIFLIAPLWYFISTADGPLSTQFGIVGIPIYQIMQQLIFLIPILLPAIILELNSRRIYRVRFPRRLILIIPIFIAGAGVYFWSAGAFIIITPVPMSIIAMAIGDSIVRKALPEPTEKRAIPEAAEYMQAVRGGEFVGNRFRFKVKVINDSNEMVTDVKVAILSYPEESLQLETEPSKNLAKLEPKGFRSPTFEFLPTTDCVKGSIIATVSFVDFTGTAHSKTTEPFTIRAVCDLLRPQKVTPEEFVEKLKALEHNEMIFKVDDWTPEEMYSKSLQTLESANFHEVESSLEDTGDYVQSRITGWAQGIYTEKNLGVEIIVSGKPTKKGATCTIRVAGEDVAMILPAIDEIAQKIQAWLCPVCAAKLPDEKVVELKSGKTTICPYCGVSMNR